MKLHLRDENGANVLEYAIILAFVLLVVVATLTVIGVETNDMVDDPALVSSLI